MTDEPPELGDVMEFPSDPNEENGRWLVLYEQDYQNLAIDVGGNAGFLVDIEQAGEVIRLGAEALAELSARDADGDDVIRDMIDRLESEVEA